MPESVTRHTPGPWHTTGVNVRNEGGALIGFATDHWSDGVAPGDPEKLANAELFAAAPFLLGAAVKAEAELFIMLSGYTNEEIELRPSLESARSAHQSLQSAIKLAKGVK